MRRFTKICVLLASTYCENCEGNKKRRTLLKIQCQDEKKEKKCKETVLDFVVDNKITRSDEKCDTDKTNYRDMLTE